MNPVQRWLTTPEWTHVVGALLHSLWQGAIIAIVLAVLMRRLVNPVTRYRCGLGALGLLVIAGLVTWAVLNAPEPVVPMAEAPVVVEPGHASRADMLENSDSAKKVVVIGERFSPVATPHWNAWLALGWIAGATVMFLRAGIKVAGAERLRRSCKPLADESVALLVAEACRAVGLARKIRVAVTDKLTSPAVVGVLVPTLILPLSLFTTLTPTQLQFVLLHELAHIRRGDYLANLFQYFAEALLFFNPAVWWISHQIRREREASCDALAIELSGAPADYARTLVRVAENILHPASAAASAFGDDGREPSTLADRVQRLLVPSYRPTLRLTWRAMLTSLFVGGALLVLSAVGTRNTVGAILTSSNPTTSPVLLGPGKDPDVQPAVAEDDITIQTTNLSTLLEFVGYDLATAAMFVPTSITGTGQSIDSDLPIFRVRQITTSNNVGDGQTNMLGGLHSDNVAKIKDKVPILGDLPFLGKLFISESTSTRRTWLNGEDWFGMDDWTVDSQQQLSRQQFWYRGGDTNARNQSTNSTIIEPLATRTFSVDVEQFYVAMREASGGMESITVSNLYPSVRKFFGKAGVDLDPLQGRSVYWNDRRGALWVRATASELDAIEKVVAQVIGDVGMDLMNRKLEARTFHINSRAVTEGLGVLWATNLTGFLQSMGVDLSWPKSIQYNQRTGELLINALNEDHETVEQIINVLNIKPPQVNLKVRWVEMSADAATMISAGIPTNRISAWGILSEEQMAILLQGNALKLFSEGQFTTLSGRQAQIQVTELMTIVTGINSNALTLPGIVSTNREGRDFLESRAVPLGPEVDLLPLVNSNSTHISLRVIPTLTEFLGYDQNAMEVPVYVNGEKILTPLPLPKYRVQQTTNECVLADGQTLVLFDFSVMNVSKQGDGQFHTTEIAAARTNQLCVLVTATLIDPAGNRLNPPK